MLKTFSMSRQISKMSKPGRPVQRLVVETLYRCRRSVALSVLLRCSAQRCTCVGNLQACGKCRRLYMSRSGHATSTIISHRLVWCRRGRSRSCGLVWCRRGQLVWCRRGRSRSGGLVWCRRGRSNNLNSMKKCIRACPGNANVCSPEISITVHQVLWNEGVWPGGVRSRYVSRRRVQAPLHQYSQIAHGAVTVPIIIDELLHLIAQFLNHVYFMDHVHRRRGSRGRVMCRVHFRRNNGSEDDLGILLPTPDPFDV